MRKKYFLLLLLLGWSGGVFAQNSDPQAILNEANEAYRRQAYPEAIQGYEALLRAGYRQAAIYYNLGNSYYRSGQKGRAILNYERARLLAPGDADIRHNLDFLYRQLPEEWQPLPEFFLFRWWKSLRQTLTTSGWGILALLCWWLGAAGLAFWQIGRTRGQRKWGFIAGMGLLLLGVLPLSLAVSRQSALRHHNRAVIVSPELSLHSAPDEQSKAIRTLSDGIAVELLDSIGQWRQVRLPNGEEGWLEGTGVEGI